MVLWYLAESSQAPTQPTLIPSPEIIFTRRAPAAPPGQSAGSRTPNLGIGGAPVVQSSIAKLGDVHTPALIAVCLRQRFQFVSTSPMPLSKPAPPKLDEGWPESVEEQVTQV